MKRLHLWLGFAALVTLLLLAACSPSTVQPTAGQAASAAPTTVPAAPTPRSSDGEITIASRADVPRITPQELKAKLDAGQAEVFDARRQLDYAKKHVAGSISLPQSEVAARLAELPSDKLAVFYCT